MLESARRWPFALARPLSVEALFHEAGMARFIIDFRRIPKDSALGRWLGQPTRHRSIGAGYDPGADANFYTTTLLPETYDGIIFIAESTAAKPLH